MKFKLTSNKVDCVTVYLQQLGMHHEPPSVDYLNRLQQKHIETFPHENIDGIYNIRL